MCWTFWYGSVIGIGLGLMIFALTGCTVIPQADGISIPVYDGWSAVLYTSPVSRDARSKTSGVVGFGLYYDNVTFWGN